MKHLAALLFSSSLVASSQAAVITQWNFDASNTTPSTGTGTATLIGTTATFATGVSGQAWNTSGYAAQSTGSGTRGVQFMASTVGYENITISFSHRASGTASRWAKIEYTVDGGANWALAGSNGGGLSPHDTFYEFTSDLSSLGIVDDDAEFGIRIVSVFAPVAFDQNASLADFAADTAYQRANAQSGFAPGSGTGTGDYGTSGTWRFDNVTISGTAIVPEPASALLGSLGMLCLLRRRR